MKKGFCMGTTKVYTVNNGISTHYNVAVRLRHTTSLNPLISRHPIIKGFASISIPPRCLSNYLSYLKGNDYMDIAKDWENIGMDVRRAMSGFHK